MEIVNQNIVKEKDFELKLSNYISFKQLSIERYLCNEVKNINT